MAITRTRDDAIRWTLEFDEVSSSERNSHKISADLGLDFGTAHKLHFWNDTIVVLTKAQSGSPVDRVLSSLSTPHHIRHIQLHDIQAGA